MRAVSRRKIDYDVSFEGGYFIFCSVISENLPFGLIGELHTVKINIGLPTKGKEKLGFRADL